jgi:cytoskeletal protein RodZ
VTIGDALAAGRRQAGMTVTQVSQRTCIRETIIRGIERDDFSGCGGDFYARGHVRSIARAVGVDPEPLIEEYDATMGAPRAISAADVFQPVTPVRLRERRKPNWTAALMVALILAAGAYGYLRYHHHDAGAAAADKAGTPAVTAHHHKKPTITTTTAHQPLHRLDIKLIATQDCWVSITSSTGVTIFQGVIYAGETKRWYERHSVTMQIGNPAGVTVIVNGKNKIQRGEITPITLALALEQPKRTHSRS